MKKQHIFFDLDGTLTDSGRGIMNSVCYALEKMNQPHPTPETLRKFIGPPLMTSFQSFCDLSYEQAQIAVTNYRVYFAEKGLFENEVYQGIPAILQQLKDRQRELYIATSKPEVYAKQILAHFNLSQYFTGIYGATLDESRSEKAAVITYALQNAQVSNLQTAVMVGDRSHDILGAKSNHLASIGVLYGFGDEAELVQAGAEHIVTTPQALGELLQSL